MACCFIWPDSDDVLNIRCYQRGQPIEFCGHGLLATTYLWRRLHSAQSEAATPILLCTATGEYLANWQRQQLWLMAPRIRCGKSSDLSRQMPTDIAAWFDKIPSRTAFAGTGYQIFEFPRGIDIANLEVNIPRLALESRAIIVTQRQTQLFDYSLRYFAPQFGNSEDSATGSANVVLADYWVQTGMKPPFRAYQCSAEGGEILSNLSSDGTHVFISGNVEFIGQKTSCER